MDKPLINRVASSGLITINLEEYYPKSEIVAFDLKDYLFMELVLKEKDFRASLKAHDWEQYIDKHVLIYCSTEAIIPVWAYMLVVSYAAPHAKSCFQGDKHAFLTSFYKNTISKIDFQQYEEKRIVVKGCSNKPVPPSAYMDLTKGLKPYAQSIMYGEPCSTVPIFKRPRKILPKK